MNKIKRERSVNFNFEERDLLVSLVFKYKDIIENKQSDATTWKKKELSWESIQQEFNARSGGAPRTKKTLRIKYEGLKRSVRKKCALIRSELYRTGGGSNTAVPLDSTEEKLKSLITLSTDGLESVFDSDMLPQVHPTQDDLGNVSMEEFIIIPSAPKIIDNSSQIKHNTIIKAENSLLEETEVEVQPSTSKETVDLLDILTDNKNEADEVTTPDKTLTPSLTINWDVTSRRNLRTKRHTSLIAKLQKKSIDDLTLAKFELVKLQKEILLAEMAEKKKESEFKEKQRQWMEEEHLLKLKILEKQLNE